MKTDASNEQLFIAAVDGAEFIGHDVEEILRLMESWLSGLDSSLHSNRIAWAGLTECSTLARQAQAVNALLLESVRAWTEQWANLEPAQALAESFDDKVLLLAFGKFNAGKSSLCNLLADRFASYGKTLQYFYLEAGRIVETSDRFVEGATETTARLQGVRLAGKLVLLDTPGLHSVTPDNATLTQRFTDAADGVLWLTSSTSPGQVQELDELGRELHRNKPLLPVVTRSDVYEEDEVDGEIKKFLRNKTPANRAEQEADVEARAREKLIAIDVPTDLLKSPVSVSSHLAREHKQTLAAMSEAGFETLFAALLAVTEPTLAYKRRKQAEVLLHHLEENVMRAMFGEVRSKVTELRLSSEAALGLLERQREKIAEVVWRSAMPMLPTLLAEHLATCDVAATCDNVSTSIIESFWREANSRLPDYFIEIEVSLARIKLDDVDFEDIVVEHPGADRTVREVVGVDYQRLHTALANAIRERALVLAGSAARQCQASIERLLVLSGRLEASLLIHEKALLSLKRKLRSEFT